MPTFFTSDTHFGDRRALHDDALVDRWNEVVGPDDEVWHLGDFALDPSGGRVAALLAALSGTKHLVIGNNDNAHTRKLPGWASVQFYAEIKAEDRFLVLCHYPFRSWNGIGKGAVNLHGHSHGRLKPITRQYDVGVDVSDFRPVSLATILARPRRSRPRRSAKDGRHVA